MGTTDSQTEEEAVRRRAALAAKIDHTILKDETVDAVRRVCAEALEYDFATVCVRLEWLPVVVHELAGSSVKPICVVGFPDGTVATELKVVETRQAVAGGAKEIDMVINLDLLRAGDFAGAVADVEAVVRAAQGMPVKVILETHLLDERLITFGCQIAEQAGAWFVKTCTGFTGGGATVEAVALMRRIVGSRLGVKASGGVRTREDVERMIAAGATRIGASASVAIVTDGAGASAY